MQFHLRIARHAAGETDLGGFRVDFSKGNVGSHYVDIAVIGQDGKLRYRVVIPAETGIQGARLRRPSHALGSPPPRG